MNAAAPFRIESAVDRPEAHRTYGWRFASIEEAEDAIRIVKRQLQQPQDGHSFYVVRCADGGIVRWIVTA